MNISGLPNILAYPNKPTLFWYAVWLMNTATKTGGESVRNLQHLLAASDSYYDPQAFILTPKNVILISAEIVKGTDYLEASKRGCLKAIQLIEEGIQSGQLMNDEKETVWIDQIKSEVESIPTSEDTFIAEMLPTLDSSKIDLKEYGIYV